jgi:F0F1-type ATP synthase delta subunit
LDEINIVIEFYKKINTADKFLLLLINQNGLNNYEKIFKYLKHVNKNEYIINIKII